MENQDFNLGQQIAEFRGEAHVGFKGINSRLDILNSKVAKHEQRLNDSDLASAKTSGIQSVLLWIASTCSAVVVALILGWIAKHFQLPLP